MQITKETTVGEIVREVPARSRIFEKLNIDYCCGGKKPLAELCAAKGLDPDTVVAMLNAIDSSVTTQDPNPDELSLTDLCDYIERVHHGLLREELPRLDFMTRKVAAVHGEHEPRLLEIREVFKGFNSEVASHIEHEDAVLFPAIRKLEKAANGGNGTGDVDLDALMKELVHEHEIAGAALERIDVLTDDYTPPEWGCNTFRALYDGLKELKFEMLQHVHKENNILFPKVSKVIAAHA